MPGELGQPGNIGEVDFRSSWRIHPYVTRWLVGSDYRLHMVTAQIKGQHMETGKSVVMFKDQGARL